MGGPIFPGSLVVPLVHIQTPGDFLIQMDIGGYWIASNLGAYDII